MADLVLFPHCDLHLALHGTPALTIRVASRNLAADNMSYTLTDVTSSCAFALFAPYNAVGTRLQQFVTIDPATGLVTPTAVGINLLQIRRGDSYILARIQVHDTILGWWFGNSSITTAKDATIAHAQPSIYALFSNDAYGADLVGDITGHRYVPLTSSSNARFVVNADGRLRGVSEGTDGILSGTFLSVTHTLPVQVVDYAKARQTLVRVRSADKDQPATKHNILFLAEGFHQGDKDKFDEIVTKIVDEIFSKARHEPYPMLGKSFNVWKAFAPAEQHAVTCGFRVNDTAVADTLSAGCPIPAPFSVSSDNTMYSVAELVARVGLPLRTETRDLANLKTAWNAQSLTNFQAAKANDEKLIAAWKAQKSLGILEARNTFFGLILGCRYADRHSQSPTVLPPTNDNPGDANLAPFIAQVYEWFTPHDVARVLSPDPRRHPPELHAFNDTNPGNSILSYIGHLQDSEAPHANVGPEWLPDVNPNPALKTFKKSRGLIAMITYEGVTGGANFNNLTILATSVAKNAALKFAYSTTATEKVMQRTPVEPIEPDIDECINTVAHEFGHSFNLGDEYESYVGDEPAASNQYDNVTSLSNINLDANFLVNRKFDPDKVKWFSLYRMILSDTLVKDSEIQGSTKIKVSIPPGNIGKWVEAKKQNVDVRLRRIKTNPEGGQLPFPVGDSDFLTDLQIESIDETNGAMVLSGDPMPAPGPVFPPGSLLFVPRRDSAHKLLFVVETKVREKLIQTNLPLNTDPDTTKVSKQADVPVDIAGFTPPCKSYKVIGVYEGAEYKTGMVYRPAGLCKMRKSSDAGEGDGEFCHVCKYLIVNRVDPGLHALLDEKYPGAKKGGG